MPANNHVNYGNDIAEDDYDDNCDGRLLNLVWHKLPIRIELINKASLAH